MKTITALLLALWLGLASTAAMAGGVVGRNPDAKAEPAIGADQVLYANANARDVTYFAPDDGRYTLRPGETLVRWPSGDLVVLPNQYAYGYIKHKIRWNDITNPYSRVLEDSFKGILGSSLCFGTAASIAYSIKTGGSFQDFWEGVMSVSSDVHPTSLMNKKRNKLYADSPIATFLQQSGFSVDSTFFPTDFGQINQNIRNGTSYIATRKSGHAVVVVRMYAENGITKVDYADAQLRSNEPVPAGIRTGQLSSFNNMIVAITPEPPAHQAAQKATEDQMFFHWCGAVAITQC